MVAASTRFLLMGVSISMLSACGHMTQNMAQMSQPAHQMKMVEASQTQSVVTLKDVLDADKDEIPTLTAVGYAVTSSQPGKVRSQKRLMLSGLQEWRRCVIWQNRFMVWK